LPDTRGHHQDVHTRDILGEEIVTLSKVKVKCTFQSKLLYLVMHKAIAYKIYNMKFTELN